MTAAEHLFKISQELPDDLLTELLDFAEFLKQKKSFPHRLILHSKYSSNSKI